MLVRRDDPESYYGYDPSLGAAALFAALYTLAFIGTVIQWARFRPTVWLVMLLAAAMEAVGYIARTISTQNTDARTVYVLQFSLLILAPVLMAGALYVLFGRIIFLVVPKPQRTFRICWVPPRFVTPIFVGFDVVALFLQLVGAVMITSGDSNSEEDRKTFDRGQDLALVGVVVQIVAFGVFTVAAIRFNFTSKAFGKAGHHEVSQEMGVHGHGHGQGQGQDQGQYGYGYAQSYGNPGGHADESGLPYRGRDTPRVSDWRPLLRAVNLSTLLILIRSVFRLIEFTEGHGGYINTHEWPFYLFDSVPIFPCVALFVWWHPSYYLPYLGFRLPKHAR